MTRRSATRQVVLALVVLVASFTSGRVAWASAGSGAALQIACSPNDITTGGGWIEPGGPAKRTFGFKAGIGPNAPFPGQLVFINHADRERLKGWIISYVPNPTNTRVMLGMGKVNQEIVAFTLNVTDNSPAAADLFSLTYSTSEGPRSATGPLGGGNIKIHPMCP